MIITKLERIRITDIDDQIKNSLYIDENISKIRLHKMTKDRIGINLEDLNDSFTYYILELIDSTNINRIHYLLKINAIFSFKLDSCIDHFKINIKQIEKKTSYRDSLFKIDKPEVKTNIPENKPRVSEIEDFLRTNNSDVLTSMFKEKQSSRNLYEILNIEKLIIV